MDEVVVFLMRQFGWTLEYTVDLVKTLETGKLNALIKEVQYQKALDDYATASNFAMAVATWASAQGRRRYKVADFIGRKPRREPITQAQRDMIQRLKQDQFIAEVKGNQDDRQTITGNESHD